MEVVIGLVLIGQSEEKWDGQLGIHSGQAEACTETQLAETAHPRRAELTQYAIDAVEVWGVAEGDAPELSVSVVGPKLRTTGISGRGHIGQWRVDRSKVRGRTCTTSRPMYPFSCVVSA